MGLLADLVRRSLKRIGSRLAMDEVLGSLPTPAEVLARFHSLWRSFRSHFLPEPGSTPKVPPPSSPPFPRTRTTEAQGPAPAPEPKPQISPTPPPGPRPAPPSPAKADLDATLPELPTHYDESRVTLLPRDPRWLHAYWSLCESDRQRVEAQGGGRVGLRLLDVTGLTDSETPHALHDHFIGPGLTHHDLGALPNRTYTVDLGFWDERGHFVSFARSPRVTTPPAEPASPGGEIFATAPFLDVAGVEAPAGTPLPGEGWPRVVAPAETVLRAPAGSEPVPLEAPSLPDWLEVRPGFPGSRPDSR
jgi:hypothetical protein